jgi:hypothetical protein
MKSITFNIRLGARILRCAALVVRTAPITRRKPLPVVRHRESFRPL